MKITIDISDFYFEDGDFQTELKNYILHEAVETVRKSISKETTEAVHAEVTKIVREKMVETIQPVIEEMIKTEKVKGRHHPYAPVTIREFIMQEFENHNGWNSPIEQIKKLATAFGDELKKRYDLLYASQIVSKLNQNGLLKEDAAKLLLEKE